MEKLLKELQHADLHSQTRRHFLQSAGFGLGALGLGSLLGSCGTSNAETSATAEAMGAKIPQFAPKAKRVIWVRVWWGGGHYIKPTGEAIFFQFVTQSPLPQQQSTLFHSHSYCKTKWLLLRTSQLSSPWSWPRC